MNKTVAIYRHQLAKPSESFIYTPLKYYSNYQTKLIGTEIWPGTHRPYPLYAPPHFTKIDRIIHRITGCNRYLNQWFTDNKPNIIHAHFAIDGLYAAHFAQKYRIPPCLVATIGKPDAAASRNTMPKPSASPSAAVTLGTHSSWHSAIRV